MKKFALTIALMLASVLAAAADDAFTFVTDGDYGYSYVLINRDLDSFSFKSDWHSLGNAGQVGYVVYTSDMSDSDRASYMEANANNPEFRKSVNGGVLDLGSLKAGDRVGFYEVRPNATYTQSAFKELHGQQVLAFDKNGGGGKDEWMSIEDISAQESGGGTGGGSGGGTGGGSGGGTGAPSGAPLPGILAVLLVGGVGAGAFKFGKKKMA